MLYCNTYRRFLMAMVIINRKPKAKTVNSTAKTTMRRSGIKKNNYSMNFTVHRNFHFLTNILESNKKIVSSTKLPWVLSFKESEHSLAERDSLPGVVVPSGHFLQNDFPVLS